MSEAHSIATMSEVEFGWYLTGLADGEASFLFWNHGPVRPNFRGTMVIELRDDDAAGLVAIRDRTGVGTLWPNRSPSLLARGNPTLRWTVSTLPELVGTIVPHFDRFPLQFKKAADFGIWRQCVTLLHASSLRPQCGGKSTSRFGPGASRMSDEEIALLIELSGALKAGRKYKPQAQAAGCGR
jgi:hypothetical protein